MASCKQELKDVLIDDSQILECSIVANLTPVRQEDDQYDLTVNYHANISHIGEREACLDLTIEVDGGDAPTYDVEIVTRTKFIFSDKATEKEKDAYLRNEGMYRAFDFAKTYIKTITSLGVWDALVLPGPHRG